MPEPVPPMSEAMPDTVPPMSETTPDTVPPISEAIPDTVLSTSSTGVWRELVPAAEEAEDGLDELSTFPPEQAVKPTATIRAISIRASFFKGVTSFLFKNQGRGRNAAGEKSKRIRKNKLLHPYSLPKTFFYAASVSLLEFINKKYEKA